MARARKTLASPASPDLAEPDAPGAGVIDTSDGVNEAEASLAGKALSEFHLPEGQAANSAEPGFPVYWLHYGIWDMTGERWHELTSGEVFTTTVPAVARAQLHNIGVRTGEPARWEVRPLD